MPRRALSILVAFLLLAIVLSVAGGRTDPSTGSASSRAESRDDTLPATLTDREFWSLVEQLSEPNGAFVSRSGSPDNLLSNEMQLSTVASALAARVRPAGVYLGVGPEQNFPYIAAIRPRIAFITDIRRGNLDLHLVYKALFEMSSSRAEFVARLFNRKPAPALPRTSSAAEVMAASAGAARVDEATFAGNVKAVVDLLTIKHGF